MLLSINKERLGEFFYSSLDHLTVQDKFANQEHLFQIDGVKRPEY